MLQIREKILKSDKISKYLALSGACKDNCILIGREECNICHIALLIFHSTKS